MKRILLTITLTLTITCIWAQSPSASQNGIHRSALPTLSQERNGTSVNGKYLDVDKELEYCHQQVMKSLKELTHDGKIDYTVTPRNIGANESHWNLKNAKTQEEWCSGFWPGILWMIGPLTPKGGSHPDGNTPFGGWGAARGYTQELEFLAYKPVFDHDLGFQMIGSFMKGYEVTRDAHYREVLLAAADTLANLFNPKVGTLLSWPRNVEKFGGHNTIIDNMINLELLLWASNNDNEKAEKLKHIAICHADTTMKYHFRPDGTVNHVAVYDPKTGKHLYNCTHQGFGDNTLWSRGQSWAMYGYTMMYRYTKEARYLAFAQKVSDVMIKQLPADGIPWWDMGDPMIPESFRDASAAAIIADALIELSGYVDKNKAATYLNTAKKILTTLSSAEYQSRDKKPSFLMHCVGNMPAGSEIDASINYGDYYYLEALLRLKKTNK